MPRKIPLVNNQVYHVYSRSIADYKIFNRNHDYQRMLMLLAYFQVVDLPTKFSYFLKHKGTETLGYYQFLDANTKDQVKSIQIIAYCLMPTHIHLVLKQLKDNGISFYLKNVLNSYTRYFNTCHHRKGPLWEGRFKNVIVKTDDQLLHLTRYLHLNPVTASLVKKPEKWQYSSYLEYLGEETQKFCKFDSLMTIKPQEYKIFVKERIDDQKELGKIKKLLFD